MKQVDFVESSSTVVVEYNFPELSKFLDKFLAVFSSNVTFGN